MKAYLSFLHKATYQLVPFRVRYRETPYFGGNRSLHEHTVRPETVQALPRGNRHPKPIVGITKERLMAPWFDTYRSRIGRGCHTVGFAGNRT